MFFYFFIIYFLILFSNIYLIFIKTYNKQLLFSLVIPADYSDYINCRYLLKKNIKISCPYVNEIFLIVSGVKCKECIDIQNNNHSLYNSCNKLTIKYYKNKQNQAENKNIGIKLSKSKYISFFDSDDEMSKYRFPYLNSLLNINKNIDMVLHTLVRNTKLLNPPNIKNPLINLYNISSSEITQSYKLNSYKDKPENRWCCKYFNLKNVSNGWSTIRRSLFNVYLFNEKIHFGEDTILNQEIILDGNNYVVIVDFPLGIYYQGSRKC